MHYFNQTSYEPVRTEMEEFIDHNDQDTRQFSGEYERQFGGYYGRRPFFGGPFIGGVLGGLLGSALYAPFYSPYYPYYYPYYPPYYGGYYPYGGYWY